MNEMLSREPDLSRIFDPFDHTISRRGLLKTAAVATAGYFLSRVLPVQAEGVYWPVEATRQWFPVDLNKAAHWGIQVLDDPNGALAEYDEVHRQERKEESGALLACKKWSDRLREMNNPAYGYCARAAISRIIFDQPSFETIYFSGHEITYPKKIALLTALATHAVPLGLTTYQWGSDESRNRLSSFVDGTARWPFVCNRPKPEQEGEWVDGEWKPAEWFVMCGDVSEDLKSVGTDDFNWGAPNWSSAKWIKMTYDTLLPGMNQIPEALKGEVDYWQSRQSSKDILIPVDLELIMKLVYGDQAGEKFNRLMVRTNRIVRIAQRAITPASSRKDFSLIAESSTICMDSTDPNFITKLYSAEFSTKPV